MLECKNLDVQNPLGKCHFLLLTRGIAIFPFFFSLSYYMLVCGLFSSPRTPTMMERDKHTCPVCIKPFPNQSSLNKHLTSHSEDRPFECSECFKKFKRIDHLNSHAMTHRGTVFCNYF